MIISGGRIFADGRFEQRDLCIEDGLFSQTAQSDEKIDATDLMVIPGLVDIHFHGCKGYDFCDGTFEAIDAIARYEASRGVTSICPATMTYPEEKLATIMQAAAMYRPGENAANLVGINMEGPFISADKVGAQNPAYVQIPDLYMFDRLRRESGGLVKIVDIAPEAPGAFRFIKQVYPHTRVSIAHTCADYDTALMAFNIGAAHVTHLFNAMPGLHHRDPGPIAAAVDCPWVTPEIIADGIHVDPAMVRIAFKMFGPERMILVSDSMMACGMGSGDWSLGGQAVRVEGRRATLKDGTIAGSATDLADCLKTAIVEMGIPAELAIPAATCNPAKAIGIDGRCGSIELGRRADCVLVDELFNVQKVILGGKVLG